ncbi:Clavaminate synthase-like protein [Alternaria alternata]|nr:Clavaminate synthase-like protein [Alternaria alternata]
MSMMRVHSSRKVSSKPGRSSWEGQTLGAVYSGKDGYFSANDFCCSSKPLAQLT